MQQSTEVCSTLPDLPIPIGRVGVPSFRSCIFHCSENRGVSARTCGTGVVHGVFLLRRKQVVKCGVIASTPENVLWRESPGIVWQPFHDWRFGRTFESTSNPFVSGFEVSPQLKWRNLKKLGPIFIQEVLCIQEKSLTRTDHGGGGSSLGSTAKLTELKQKKKITAVAFPKTALRWRIRSGLRFGSCLTGIASLVSFCSGSSGDRAQRTEHLYWSTH